ncbi:YqiA/YcfP family alpha/beta fold hydrolase [uncultured Croceitalea sp.]|uniref:YqiA/YcfP family alpha/beta fold hydrolase n=1 Tax=uncultured Croceitalea sp. TaxID=1798908 RepID=UPI00330639F2
MKHSFTYYLTLFVIKLRGLKSDFSKDPIEFKKIRQQDVQSPKGRFFKRNTLRTFEIANSLITEIGLNKNSNTLLLYIHGGAFISGPAQHHWDSLKEIVKKTNYIVWMCAYPKAPEHKISEISASIDAIYNEALAKYKSDQISLIGDSVGGTLITSLTQRLIQKNIKLPKQVILISPVVDAAMTNPEIEAVDKIDPMLSKVGVLSAKKMCAENDDLTNVMISPINGSFDDFPRTLLFVAKRDITYSDQLLAIKRLKDANVNIEVIEGENMPHIWPLLPVMKEAKVALCKIIDELNHYPA